MKYRLSPNTRIEERNGDIYLISDAPVAILQINNALKELLQSIDSNPLSEPARHNDKILEQLAERGFLQSVRDTPITGISLPTVSIIIPVKDRAEELQRSLLSLALLNYPAELIETIVVDDGSSDDSAEIARKCGARVLSSGGVGLGPASARNVGARAASGEILAFIDSDCTASEGWLKELVPSFSDSFTAAVGGFVDGMCRDSSVDRYESVMSSLSLGNRERSSGDGDDTFYLPSCNLLVRRIDFMAAGGFRDQMHVGEDVDLTWRLRDKGRSISYLPAGRIYHAHRSSIRSFMSRRFDYGTSEGILQQLHPKRRKQMVVPPMLALILAFALISPLAGWYCLAAIIAVFLLDLFRVQQRLNKTSLSISFSTIAAGRLRAIGSLAYYLSFHVVRYYSLPLIAFALWIPWLWLPYLCTTLISSGVDFKLKKPNLSFVAFYIIYLMEHISYGTGVFWGCISRGSFRSYRVVLMNRMELNTQS